MAETISNINNRYIIAKEDSFGTIPASPTKLDFGYVQTISIAEDDTVEEVSAINTYHTLAELDDDLYNLSGSITTKVSNPSLSKLLEALCGKIEGDTPTAGEYTISTEAITSDDTSYFMKVNTTYGKILEMTGLFIKSGEVSVERDGSVEMTLEFQAKKLSPATETLSPITPVGKLLRGLDASVTYDGHDTILDNFSFSIDWHFDEGDSRGIENVGAGERRLIQRVIRNEMELTGSFTSHMDDNIDIGYVDDRSSVPIVLTLSRGDYSHVFTISSSKTSTRSRELGTGEGKKTISCDYKGIDIGVIGDEYTES